MKKAICVWIIALILFVVYLGLQTNMNKTESVSEISSDCVYPDISSDKKDDTVVISVCAAGDCTLGVDIAGLGNGCFDDEFEKQGKNYDFFFENVKDIFKNDDLTIVNLEGPLSDRGERQDKEFAFRGKPEYAKILSHGSVEAANLSNNHSMDYGEIALGDTKASLDKESITHFGLGEYEIKEIKGIKVALVGTSLLRYEEREDFPKIMEKIKLENPDLIIASFHWGEENMEMPTYDQKDFARKAVDMGADLVIGHHPHVIQGIEKYNGSYIVYSLGNFCFGGNRYPKERDTFIFNQKFYFKDGAEIFEKREASIFPCCVSSDDVRNNFQPTPLKGAEFERVKEKIMTRSAEFTGIEDVMFFQ